MLEPTQVVIPASLKRPGPLPEGWAAAVWCELELRPGQRVRLWTGTRWSEAREVDEARLDPSRYPTGLVGIRVGSLEIVEEQALFVAVPR